MILCRTTFPEIHASGLTAEYALECAMEGMPAPDMQIEQYNQMDAAGIIYPMGAYLDDRMIGFITVLSPVLPHYGVKVAVTESYFVGKEYRGTGAGAALREWAETHAAVTGCVGVLVSAPHGGDLEKVLPRCGYRESNRVFFKGV